MRDKVLKLLENSFDALDLITIADSLGMNSVEDIEKIKSELDILVSDLTVYYTKKNKYILYSKCPNFRVGKISINKAGNGFVILDEEDDLFVPRENLNFALNGDKVLVELLSSQNRKIEGRIIKILERDLNNVVGIIKTINNELFFEMLDNSKNISLTVDKDSLKSCVDGEIVAVRLIKDLGKNRYIGEVSEHICHKDDANEDILTIAAKYEIYANFPQDVNDSLEDIPNEITNESLEQERNIRVDLTDRVIFTIDGDDTKDIDDAISLSYDGENYNLLVSIADVSFYVGEGSPLDKEAYRRGTSSYLADAVIPMLPHKLSNGICSLNPGVLRYALTCDMTINNKGKVISSDIYPSIIKSAKKMTYKAVNNILNEGIVEEGYEEFKDTLLLMQKLAHIIREERTIRGASNFQTVEAKIICDDTGKAIDVERRIQDEGEKLIEDFMVIANETVAQTLENMGVPSIYRVHDIPKPERVQNFLNFVSGAGYKVVGKFNNITQPKMYQKLLDQITSQGDEAGIINSLAVRTMNKAVYSSDNIGHFGLASRSYTHFTSPIRRYPDLMVHRLIRTYIINGQMDERTIDYYESNLASIAEQASEREIAAVEAEREVVKMKCAEYMEDHIGEEYEAYISGVLRKGFFVQTKNLVEGLVSVESLKGDYYNFDEERLALIGENSKRVFKLGDKVNVKCVAASKILETIDFELIGVEKSKKVVDNKKHKKKSH